MSELADPALRCPTIHAFYSDLPLIGSRHEAFVPFAVVRDDGKGALQKRVYIPEPASRALPGVRRVRPSKEGASEQQAKAPRALSLFDQTETTSRSGRSTLVIRLARLS